MIDKPRKQCHFGLLHSAHLGQCGTSFKVTFRRMIKGNSRVSPERRGAPPLRYFTRKATGVPFIPVSEANLLQVHHEVTEIADTADQDPLIVAANQFATLRTFAPLID
ncbi:hypothetical protein [Shinella zoogloeoides]|uniref:hypothetical protein n=1 Tax=Shinella zoogloeoides TaxID=352475 RepID=UPI00273EE568|nr:hypothetical protein [Shinella zoogloeoides]WLR91644.1 hypothetical protein Q9316_14240 [Shinella zoogloeoides]